HAQADRQAGWNRESRTLVPQGMGVRFLLPAVAREGDTLAGGFRQTPHRYMPFGRTRRRRPRLGWRTIRRWCRRVMAMTEAQAMVDQVAVRLPDGAIRQYPKGTTVADVAKDLGGRIAREALVARV